MQVEHIRLISPGLKAHLVVNRLIVHPLSKLWFQIVNLHPYGADVSADAAPGEQSGACRGDGGAAAAEEVRPHNRYELD